MKAFLSYSLNDTEHFIVTLLAQKLQEQGFYVTSGTYASNYVNNAQTNYEISTSNLFIGIITEMGQANKRVFNEWDYANHKKTPALLFVEDSYVFEEKVSFPNKIIRFNRKNPQPAIDRISQKQADSKRNKQITDESMAWLLGGMALLALILLLSYSES
ncbi:MAG: hypothetical protein ACPG5B_04340 [Chitinophagales bacterium]